MRSLTLLALLALASADMDVTSFRTRATVAKQDHHPVTSRGRHRLWPPSWLCPLGETSGAAKPETKGATNPALPVSSFLCQASHTGESTVHGRARKETDSQQAADGIGAVDR